jgi:hypothetical protein
MRATTTFILLERVPVSEYFEYSALFKVTASLYPFLTLEEVIQTRLVTSSQDNDDNNSVQFSSIIEVLDNSKSYADSSVHFLLIFLLRDNPKANYEVSTSGGT